MTPILKPTLLLGLTCAALACRPQPIIVNSPEAAASAAKAEKAEQHSLSVKGLATMEVSPDRLDLRVQLREQARRPDQVIKKIRAKQASLERAIDAAGLGGVEQVIGRLNLHEHYERQGKESVKVGYRASIHFTISMTDFDQVGPFMQIGAENGAESMSTQFRSTELSSKKTEVRKLAVEAAMAKAQQLASLSGAKLGAVMTIHEGDFQNVYWGHTQVANEYVPAAASQARRSGDSQKLSINVTIQYRLESS